MQMLIVFTGQATAWHRIEVQQLPPSPHSKLLLKVMHILKRNSPLCPPPPTHKFVNLSCGVNILRTDSPRHGKPIQQLTIATKPPHHLINYIHMHLIKH